MPRKTKLERDIEGLKGSIEHWKRLKKGVEGEHLGPAQCPLCRMYLLKNSVFRGSWCHGCPIFQKTKQESCDGTPYVQATVAKNGKDFKPVAQKEINFLRKILAEKEQLQMERVNAKKK